MGIFFLYLLSLIALLVFVPYFRYPVCYHLLHGRLPPKGRATKPAKCFP